MRMFQSRMYNRVTDLFFSFSFFLGGVTIREVKALGKHFEKIINMKE